MSLKVVVVVVVVSTGRSTGFTPYPTNGYPVLDFASVGQVFRYFRTLSYFLMVLPFTQTLPALRTKPVTPPLQGPGQQSVRSLNFSDRRSQFVLSCPLRQERSLRPF